MTSAPDPVSDEELHAFLDEQLPAERLAELEERLRTDEELLSRLRVVIRDADEGVHSLGAVWRRDRLTCPSRTQLGGYILGTLDAGFADYLTTHLERVGCRYCRANLEDLRASLEADADQSARRNRIFESSVGRLRSS